MMGSDEVNEQCKYILKHLSKSRPDQITVRDVMRLCQRFKKAEDLTKPMNRLTEYGYLMELPSTYSGTGRRPPQSWEVNPAAYG